MAKFKNQCSQGSKASRYILLLYANENSTNINNNTSNVSFTLQLAGGNYDGDNYNQYGSSFYGYTCNGTINVYNNSTGALLATFNGSSNGTVSNSSAITIASGIVDLPHNSDGSLNIRVEGSFSGGLSSQASGGSVSGTTDLTTIPRYANITSFSVSKRDETSVIVNFSVDADIDYCQYSINDTGWVDTGVSPSSRSFVISNLSVGTGYNFRIQVRRSGSPLFNSSGLVYQETYNYPYCISANNFTIEQPFTINLYNPLGRNVNIDVLGIDNSVIASGSTSGTSITGFNDTESIDKQYKSIPNTKSAMYRVKVTYGSNNSIITNSGTYSVNENLCKPIINTGTYEDTNNDTLNITNNNQQIIRNQSIVEFNSTFTTQKYATAQSCKITINSIEYNMSINNNSASVGNIVIDNAMNLTATITLTDSRNISITKEVNITILDWILPTAIITLKRQNNYYTETDIKVDASYSSIDSKNTISIKTRYKKPDDSSYSNYVTLQDNVTSIINLDNNYEWLVQVLVTDLFGSTTYNLSISRGMPIIFFDRIKNSVGHNCFPTGTNTLETNGHEVLVKDNIAIITGIIVENVGTGTIQTVVSYPSGFNKNNSVVLSLGISNQDDSQIIFGTQNTLASSITGGFNNEITLDENSIIIRSRCIYLRDGNPVTVQGWGYDRNFKLVLMKIN